MKQFHKLSFALLLSVAAGPLLASETPGEGVTVRPVVTTQIEEFFQHRILFRALEDLGYTIAEPQEVEYQTLHMALGAGDGDFSAVHWNTLHHAFFEEAGGEAVMTKVGTLVEGALQGYLVDKATYDAGVQSLGDLKDPAVAAKFDGDGDGKADLAGCVPGWGCEAVIEHQLTEFGLRDTVTHNQGSYNAIIADTIARQQNGEPILYYTWTPYWVSGALVPGKDVEWLSVPYTSLPGGAEANTTFDGKNLGFAVDSIRVLARNDFLEANPAAAKLFEIASIDINDISAENKLIADGEDSSDDIDKHVSDWIAAHQAEYDGWLAEARKAAE
ncbi:glycine betaine/L-proline ABC transporter substrate-binding protein ProX [Cereibacter sphaeroides]|uniref:glycine betaine/L-proline ABC transporter substrate-binding protein ProX n=1 Tax=Cereibacter sphaeroides TaxID=1063 RepID=UPI001F333161|nr:glycine betaine/L-proline ABC transporter substrate-binding protein ProX [Cereibacter sphaeroides]MCE6950796.1 glycine betaine/L-proline ABC transporter substrate-binding protein ProX [Cereibacter sphaeroides]MCE6959816.1 glycine betaine/L-proline ABC transporter substrate-binding protein ProX [Cereibacter sphaeroides]MCE6968716.1 glycine betaine/L-proline ABC transporter substrate-binding protein ProX [Cereibacter sphaeroides]MCE6974670.1 glycine betaine/L-proline ABC transporter substrate-